MSVWAVTFALIGLTSVLFAWGSASGTLASVAMVLAVVFLGLAVISFVLHIMR